MARADSWSWAVEQFEYDATLVRALRGVRLASGEDAQRWMLAKKREKLSASAFGFFRGSLGFFDRALNSVRATVADATGEGWLVGDAHAENFGVLRSDRSPPWDKGELAFWVNDYDAVREGAYVDDVLRLCTSALLAGAARSVRAADSLQWIDAALDGYLSREIAAIAKPVLGLRKKVEHRSYGDFLAARTRAKASGLFAAHEFIRGDRYADLGAEQRAMVEDVARSMDQRYPRFEAEKYARFRVDDVAFRVAGNGSLGCFRAAISIKPIEREAPPWLFDLKALTVSAKKFQAARAALSAPDADPVVLSTNGLRLLLRTLAPQEDKLAMEKVDTEHFEPLFRYLGSVLGAAHHSGRARPRWGRAARVGIRQATITLFGAHQAGHLAYAALARDEQRAAR